MNEDGPLSSEDMIKAARESLAGPAPEAPPRIEMPVPSDEPVDPSVSEPVEPLLSEPLAPRPRRVVRRPADPFDGHPVDPFDSGGSDQRVRRAALGALFLVLFFGIGVAFFVWAATAP